MQQGKSSDYRYPEEYIPSADPAKKLQLSKSSSYYQEKVLLQSDKYAFQRIRVKELFHEEKNKYGYPRIHALLRREAIIV